MSKNILTFQIGVDMKWLEVSEENRSLEKVVLKL